MGCYGCKDCKNFGGLGVLGVLRVLRVCGLRGVSRGKVDRFLKYIAIHLDNYVFKKPYNQGFY